MLCKICGRQLTPLSKARVLNKYDVQYYSCINCGLVQTEPPYWLGEAYSAPIARSDIGLIGRNIKLSNITTLMIRSFFNSNERYLDYGGGNGMFVRMMRDKGYDFFWFDKFTPNQFAAGFEVKGMESFELVTAFEVFEHLIDPIAEIENMTSFSKNILFSTILLPKTPRPPQDWWYYTLDTGQHVSLYSKRTLLEIAHRFELNLYTNGISIHLLTEKRLPTIAFWVLSVPSIANFLYPLFLLGKKSLLGNDYFQLTGKHLK